MDLCKGHVIYATETTPPYFRVCAPSAVFPSSLTFKITATQEAWPPSFRFTTTTSCCTIHSYYLRKAHRTMVNDSLIHAMAGAVGGVVATTVT